MNTIHTFPRDTACEQQSGSRDQAFTLLELLVVIAVLAMLGATLLPAFANNRIDSQMFVCMNNTKRLTTAWLIYASENQDRLMSALFWDGGQTYAMDWTSSSVNTNSALLLDPTRSLIAMYVREISLFKCPADVYQSPANPGPRVRSYSMSGGVGGAGLAPFAPSYPPGRTYLIAGAAKMTDLNRPGPASVIVFGDEHPDSINDGILMFSAGYPPASFLWRDLPGSSHNGAGSFSFADGHSEVHKWQDSRTTLPVRMQTRWWKPVGVYSVPNSVDYSWFNDRMPYR
jgi:prepilin-type N-terminal cleavage/methylation domain-containing protein/prepilin-type processing-associated H-X9-DG protein